MTTPSDHPPVGGPPGTTAAGGPTGSAAPGVGGRTGMPGAAGTVPPGPAGVPSVPAQFRGAGAPSGPTVAVATYPEYAAAQQAVDYLSDNKFPVERTAIVGTDLRLVENVLGRLTVGRAAGAGVASGAWLGLFIGVIFALFSNTAWLTVLLVSVLIGAVWGAVFGAIAHAATGGRRDFSSRSSLQASQYAVIAEAEVAEQARQLLTRLNWRTSGAS